MQAAEPVIQPGVVAGVRDGSPASDAGLREGRRQTASILFLDLRDSTALAERMDPKRLLIFITSFRRRVIAAARATAIA